MTLCREGRSPSRRRRRTSRVPVQDLLPREVPTRPYLGWPEVGSVLLGPHPNFLFGVCVKARPESPQTLSVCVSGLRTVPEPCPETVKGTPRVLVRCTVTPSVITSVVYVWRMGGSVTPRFLGAVGSRLPASCLRTETTSLGWRTPLRRHKI